ncbi:MAG: Ca-activated chloride channel family protein [Rubritalea sp.]|jgi:Ca-activated chloride channel family protein
MTFFAHPELLWLLSIPVCLAFWEWVRKGHAIVLPIDHQNHKSSIWLGLLIHTANMLPTMLMATAVIFLARPMTQAPPEVVRKATNIQIVLDLSGSMDYSFGPQNASGDKPFLRIDAAMNAIEKFVDYRKGDSFGLTVYGKPFINWVPLTQDTSAIKYARPFMTGFLQSTRTFTALAGATDELIERAEGERMIILVTDGESNSEPDPARQVEELLTRFADENVICYGIFISEKEVPELERMLCEQSGGGLFNIEDEMKPDSLDQLFARIDKMTKVNMKLKESIAVDNFKPFILPTLIVLLLHVLALFGLRYTPW